MMTDSTGAERSAATGVACRDMNQFWTSFRVMSAICRPRNQGRIWLFRYHLFTFRVDGFQRRDWLRNASSAMVSNLVSSAEATAGRPLRTAARTALAASRASARLVWFASPMSFQMRCPLNCVWMKYRFRPEGRILRPKPLRFASRTFRVFCVGLSALILASVSRIDGTPSSRNQLQTRTKRVRNQSAVAI